MKKRSLMVSLGLVLAVACGSEDAPSPGPSGVVPPGTLPDGGPGTDPAAADATVVVFGTDVLPAVKARLLQHLKAVRPNTLEIAPDAAAPELGERSLLLAFGKTVASEKAAPDDRVTALGPEGYVLQSAPLGKGLLLAARGNPAADHAHGNLGTAHAAYALLEELGFAFLHPLAPVRPSALTVPTKLEVATQPRWKKREIHLHTQHPLELTELLQGMGPGGGSDESGYRAMLPEWDRFLEWCVANGQNGVEWFLLYAKSFEAFSESDARAQRLGELVAHAHDLGISAGLDVPVAFGQQHAFRLLRNQGELPAELAEIRQRLDWVMRAKFDFLGTEAGTSEFTAPAPDRMLAWLNEMTIYADTKYQVPVFVKVHASTGQKAAGYKDPRTGQDINFNFLPHFADKRLGVLPHTVQHYSLTDPAPTYGNTDFSYIRDFLHYEIGKRPVVWYPETAYWVSFDVDVPLFLPLYAERRSYDLRLIAGDEEQKRRGNPGKRMDGQLLFSSGWEWGYWLNDTVAARAAFDPHIEAATDAEAFRKTLSPILRVFGPAAAEVEQWIVDTVAAEQALLIEGKVSGRAPASIDMRNGQAYLQGWETWDDVSKLSESLPVKLPMTQPDKLGLVDMRNPLHGGPKYTAEVDPLLTEMEQTFTALASRGKTLAEKIPANARDLFDDLRDAMIMTSLRAKQVHGLYDYVDGYFDTNQAPRKLRLQTARTALDEAQAVVRAREPRYRVPADRIAGWRPNPTAYDYGYLWTVRSLHYFWRDEGKAVDAPVFPCYQNVINPVDVAQGEGFGTDAVRFFGSVLSSDQSRGCLAEPETEPKYPQENLRTRP